MKTKTRLLDFTKELSVHRTNEKGLSGKRAPVWYVSDGKTVSRLNLKGIDQLISESSGRTFRFTAVNSSDIFLLDLERLGATIRYCHWHRTGIEKGLPAEQIAAKVSELSSELFREWHPRQDIAGLRRALSLRNAIVELMEAADNKFKQATRDKGLPASFESREEQTWLDNVEKGFKVIGEDGKAVKLDKNVEKLAKMIPECVIFNEVAHLTSGWITAASVVALTSGVERFDTVHQFWKYCGQHVTDGHAPKRQKGIACNWSTELRAVGFNFVSMSLIKHQNNPWYARLEEFRALEIERHAKQALHVCKNPEWHIELRARRRVWKEVLKQFFLKAKGIQYNSSHDGDENRDTFAAVAGA